MAMKKIAIRILMDMDLGDGSLKIEPWFFEEHGVSQLDVLKDAIFELSELYQSVHSTTFGLRGENDCPAPA